MVIDNLQLMSWENIVWWYSSLYWYGHIGLVASFLLLKVLAIIAPPPRTARPIKTEETKTEAVKTQ